MAASRLLTFLNELARSTSPGARGRAIAAVLLAGATDGIGLLLLAPLIDAMDAAAPRGTVAIEVSRLLAVIGLSPSLPVLLAVFVGLVVVRGWIIRWREIALTRLRLDFTAALRQRLHRAIAAADWLCLLRERTADFTKTLTADIDRIANGTHFCLRLPALAFLGVVQIAIALAIAPWPSAALLVGGGGAFLLLHRYFGGVDGLGVESARTARTAAIVIGEFVNGLKLVKSHDAQAHHIAIFDKLAERQRALALAFARTTASHRIAFQIGAAVALSGFIYVESAIEHLARAELLVTIVIFARLTPLLSELQQGWQLFLHMLPVFGEMQALRDRCEAAAEKCVESGSERLTLRRELRLSRVCFRHGKDRGDDTLANIDLVIPAQSITAIVGPSGGGKSTIADMMIGLLMPDSGEVLLDGMKLTGAMVPAWRRNIAYVPQDNFLFNETVRDNLLWACPSAGDDDLRHVLALTAADGFVAALPDGLDTVVGERGVRLSGGERQRIALARALLRRPTLLVLDEATNALDNETEHAVQSAIERLRGTLTIVMISHRHSSLRLADRIFVVDEGRIIDAGTFDEISRQRNENMAPLRETGAAWSRQAR